MYHTFEMFFFHIFIGKRSKNIDDHNILASHFPVNLTVNCHKSDETDNFYSKCTYLDQKTK